MAGVAQSVEQLICNQPVGGSNPLASSNKKGCIPVTWFTPYSGDIVNTFSGAKGLGPGSTRLSPSRMRISVIFFAAIRFSSTFYFAVPAGA